jgi:DNA-binding NtrC family response regulator
VQDIPRLVHHFLQRMAEHQGTAPLAIPAETIHLLQRYSWPGNVRELANAIERAVILCRGTVLLPSAFDECLQEAEVPSAPPAGLTTSPAAATLGAIAGSTTEPLPFALEEIERRAIERALEATGGNRTRAAKLLGISERTLRNRLNTPRPSTSSETSRPA